MGAALAFYLGVLLGLSGLVLTVKPIRRLRVRTRAQGLRVLAAGLLLAGIALLFPVSERRAGRLETRLDAFAPAWQFREVHTLRIAAPPARVYGAIRRVRADEIALFRALTWIRRGGRAQPPGILNPGDREPILDVAIKGGFVSLVDSAPREIVIGTVVMAPAGSKGTLTAEVFQRELPPGFAIATMNFLLTADGSDGTLLSTETRVFANSAAARRRFAVYWRMIYPGSALIRRMWLRAIGRRATSPGSEVWRTRTFPPHVLSAHSHWRPA